MGLLDMAIDAFMTYDGDIRFSDGDIKLSTGSDRLTREVHRLLMTDVGDWKVYTDIGASSERFIGRQNTRDLGIELQNYIKYKLSKDLEFSLVDVRVIPNDIHSLLVLIDIIVFDDSMQTIVFNFDNTNGFIRRDYNDVIESNVTSLTLNTNANLLVTHNNIWDKL